LTRPSAVSRRKLLGGYPSTMLRMVPLPILEMGRIQKVRPLFSGAQAKHLLLLLALELLVVEVAGAALVGGELAGHRV
jgi:hypothetical protein